jgi:hypothetical protein
MKKLAFLLLIASLAFAQHSNKSDIIDSDDYYYGAAISFNIDEARDKALSELTKQIVVRVSSSFTEKIQENDKNLTECTESILKTHSAATLRNVRTIQKPASDGSIEVFCYLKKSEVQKIFNERKKLIYEMAKKAENYTGEYNFAYALKLYYFAAILLNSLPDQNVIFNGINYTTELPERINKIILKIGFDFQDERQISEKEREVTLKVHSKKHPVALLDFTFWNGNNQISVQARDGFATLRLVGSSIKFDDLKLNIKYAYYDCRDEYSVVSNLWNIVNKPAFKAQKTVQIKKKPINALKSLVSRKADLSKFNIKLEYEDDNAPVEEIIKETQDFLDILESGNISKIEDAFTDDDFMKRKAVDYLTYNNACPLDKNILSKLNKTRDGWELRRIRMLHQYPSIHKQSTEYLVLDFSEDGELVDLNIAITDFLYNRFVEESKYSNDWVNRQEIIKFLEKYRTAYMTRDIETVDLMFAEDAIIIIGRKLKRKILPPDLVGYQQFGNQPDYEYLTFKKSEYITRQKQIFKYQKDILLDFASFDIIRKNNASDIYGVEMRQNYTSTTYTDEGYLFLLIDFSEVDPLIYVRAWQPNTWSKEQLIRTANFKIWK